MSTHGLPRAVVQLLKTMEAYRDCLKWNVQEGSHKITLTLSWSFKSKVPPPQTGKEWLWNKIQVVQNKLRLSKSEDGLPDDVCRFLESAGPVTPPRRPPLRRQFSLGKVTWHANQWHSMPSYTRYPTTASGGGSSHHRHDHHHSQHHRRSSLSPSPSFPRQSSLSPSFPRHSSLSPSPSFPRQTSLSPSFPRHQHGPSPSFPRQASLSPSASRHLSPPGSRSPSFHRGLSTRFSWPGASSPVAIRGGGSLDETEPTQPKTSTPIRRSKTCDHTTANGATAYATVNASAIAGIDLDPPDGATCAAANNSTSTNTSSTALVATPHSITPIRRSYAVDYSDGVPSLPSFDSLDSPSCGGGPDESIGSDVTSSHRNYDVSQRSNGNTSSRRSSSSVKITYRSESEIDNSLEDLLERTKEENLSKLERIRCEWNKSMREAMEDPITGDIRENGVLESSTSDSDPEITETNQTVQRCLSACDNILYKHSTMIT